MKTRTLVSIKILILVVLVVTMSYVTDRKGSSASENEVLYGTWINEEYEGGGNAKLIIHADGTQKWYLDIEDTREQWTEKCSITETWNDTDGTIWYKIKVSEAGSGAIVQDYESYYTMKISHSGKVLEFSWSSTNFPPVVEPDNLRYNYAIFYRQE